MMRQLLLVFIMLTGTAFSAEVKPEKIGSIHMPLKFFSTDNLGNVYLVSASNDLLKYNNSGLAASAANFKLYGNLASVDATNPFEIYLFYKEQNRLVFVDNLLALRGVIDFSSRGLGQVSAVARSFDNGIWLFDLNDLQLKKLDKDLKLQASSGNTLSITSRSISPNFILDNQDRVYMNNPSTGILVFDAFANYMKTIPVKDLQSFQVMDNKLVYFQKGNLYSYDLKLLNETKISLADSSQLLNARIEKERLYLLKGDTLNLYSF